MILIFQMFEKNLSEVFMFPPLRTLLEGDELESFAGERDDVLLFDGELEDDSFEEGVWEDDKRPPLPPKFSPLPPQ